MCWGYLSSDKLGKGDLVIRRISNSLLKAWMWDLEPHCADHPFLEYAFLMWEDHAVASYPALLDGPEINVMEAVTLRDAWLLRTAKEGQNQVLELLYNKRADPNIKDKDCRTPLSLAAEYGHKEVVQQLLAKGQVNANSQDDYGRTPLLWAAKNDDKEVVQQQLATGQVNADSQDKNGGTPLSWAAENGHKEIA